MDSVNVRGDRDVERFELLLVEPDMNLGFVLNHITFSDNNMGIIKRLIQHPVFLDCRYVGQADFLYGLFDDYLRHKPPTELLEMTLSFYAMNVYRVSFSPIWELLLQYAVQYELPHVIKRFVSGINLLEPSDSHVQHNVQYRTIEFARTTCPDSPMLSTLISTLTNKEDNDPLVRFLIAFINDKVPDTKALLPQIMECAKNINLLFKFVGRYHSPAMMDMLLDTGVLGRMESLEDLLISLSKKDYTYFHVFMKYCRLPENMSKLEIDRLLTLVIQNDDLNAIKNLLHTDQLMILNCYRGLVLSRQHEKKHITDEFIRYLNLETGSTWLETCPETLFNLNSRSFRDLIVSSRT